MRFRYHRGGLKESMETCIEVNSMDELREKLDNPTTIEFKHLGMDTRVNWDTYYVIADGKIAGMSDSDNFTTPEK